MSIELKVKAATLSMEAVYIRRLQRKLAKSRARINAAVKADMDPDHVRDNRNWFAENLKTNHALYTHRTGDIRQEARATHLARMFLKDRPYAEVEQFTWLFPDALWDKIWAMVRKYAPHTVKENTENTLMWAERFKEWKTAAVDLQFEMNDVERAILHRDRRAASRMRQLDIIRREGLKAKWLREHPTESNP